MSTEEVANVSEGLNDLHEGLAELAEGFQARSTSTQNLVDLFAKIISSEHTLREFWNNRELRSNTQGILNNVTEMNKTYDPNFLRKLEILQTECQLLVRMIQIANDTGAPIK